MANPPSITELIHDIEEGDLILPEFQRGYVWTPKQVREYMDSLYRGYPTGNLLIWKTPQPGRIRGTTSGEDRHMYQLILDGQQRLTSVYTLVKAKAPPFYEGEQLYFDLYFNVVTEEFSYYKRQTMRGSLEWVPVSPFLKSGLGEYMKTGGPLEPEQREFLLGSFDRLSQLDQVKQYTYYPDYLNQREMSEVVRIFDLVNSRGTRLSKSDLALSHICASWPEARQTMRALQAELASQGFDFRLDFFIRCVASVATNAGTYEPLYRTSIDEIRQAWKRTEKALAYVLNVLRTEAYIDSVDSLATDIALVPLVVYVANGPGRFHGEKMKRSFLHWLYLALALARYSGSTESKLNEDIQALTDDHPPDRLRQNLLRMRGRLKVLPEDFKDRGVSSPLYPMAYILARHQGAVDWFNGLPLYSTLIGKANGLHNHHIFPQAVLYKSGRYASAIAADKNRVNEIANLAFLTAEANLKVSAQLPGTYLPGVLGRFPDALTQQFVSETPALWDVDRFEDFLADRRERLARAINEYLDGLLKYTGADAGQDVGSLIKQDEGQTLEFKASLRWDYHQEAINKELERVVARTLAAFMNADGGTLVIGVRDGDHAVLGLDADMKTISNQDLDGWENTLRTALNNHLDKDVAAMVSVGFADIGGASLALVKVDRSVTPIFVKGQNQSEFHVRAGNRSELYDSQQAAAYIKKHFSELSS